MPHVKTMDVAFGVEVALLLVFSACQGGHQYAKNGATEFELEEDKFKCESPEFGKGAHAPTGDE
jgi:hypothetical protein